jgi:large subunit ribosomal protein L4
VARQLKKFNIEGKEIGSAQVEDALCNTEISGQLVKDYIVAMRANARQWSANTKGRSEVSHSTQKPHPQKGGGRSRQGSLAAPQYKGGGRVFAPKPKFDQHVRINQKEKRAAILALFAEKIQNDRMVVLDSAEMAAPKTKTCANFLKLATHGPRVLFLFENSYEEVEKDGKKVTMSRASTQHDNFKKSSRNIPKTTFSNILDVNGYDLICHSDVVITEGALKQLHTWLGE